MIVTKTTPTARYYDAYLAFFADYLQSHSPTEALERFVFSPAYNFKSHLASVDRHDSKEKVEPQVLNVFWWDWTIHLFTFHTGSSLASSDRS